jgi:hypothetical protein
MNLANNLDPQGNSIRWPASYDTTIDGLPAFDTKDLVMFHPNNPKLWKLVGRAGKSHPCHSYDMGLSLLSPDDQITHSTGVSNRFIYLNIANCMMLFNRKR